MIDHHDGELVEDCVHTSYNQSKRLN